MLRPPKLRWHREALSGIDRRAVGGGAVSRRGPGAPRAAPSLGCLTRGDRETCSGDGVYAPAIWHALEFVFTLGSEVEAAAGDEVFHCLGDEDLGRAGECCDACACGD